MNPPTASHSLPPASNPAYRLGFYAAILAAVLTLGTFVLAFLTPPLSGPGCQAGCFTYPYADIAARFPRDYLWMAPAILISFVFVVLVVSIHHTAPPEKRVFSHLAVLFAAISAAVLIGDYSVQLTVIQPSLLNGEADGIALLTQFNSHGLFIALEEIGFLMVSVAFLCLAPAFAGRNRLEAALRWLFILAFVLTILALVFVSLQMGVRREYIFEIIAISINWTVLIISGILLSVYFRRALRTPALCLAH
jgi:hypothetical protein